MAFSLQGLHVVQKEKNGTCFVYPTYHKYEEGRKVERYVASGKTIFTNVDIVRFEPLGPYSIKETDFLPAEAKDYCKGDYKWVEVVEHKVGMYSVQYIVLKIGLR